MVEAMKKTDTEMPALAPSERPPSEVEIGSEVPVDVGTGIEVRDGSGDIGSTENEAAGVWVGSELVSKPDDWLFDDGGRIVAVDVLEGAESPGGGGGGGFVASASEEGALDDGKAELAAGPLPRKLGATPTA